MPEAPQLDPETVRAQLDCLSRQPFRDLLARFLLAAPSAGAIVEQAEKHPDRWAQSTAIVGRLAGFTEKLEVEGTLTHKIQDLSDVQLQARLAALTAQLDMQSRMHQADPRVDTGDAQPS